MQIKKLHSWNLSYSEAIKLQKRLAPQVQLTPLKNKAKLIAGIDCAFSKDGEKNKHATGWDHTGKGP